MRESFSMTPGLQSAKVDLPNAGHPAPEDTHLQSLYAFPAAQCRVDSVLRTAAMPFATILLCACAATGQNPAPQAPASQSVPAQAARLDSSIPVFHINGREVLVDVIALSGRGEPVLNLTPAEFQVSQAPETVRDAMDQGEQRHISPAQGTIVSLQIVDPNAARSSDNEPGSGVQIAASCLERSTAHYRLAFRAGPDAWRSGYHAVTITTTRRGVRLFYAHKYYVGLTEPPAKPLNVDSRAVDKLLLQAACYYPATPPSIALRATFIDTGQIDVLRYSVTLDTNAISFAARQETGPNVGIARRGAVDYGICTFDNQGLPIAFFHAPLDVVLTSPEYARALDRGFPHVLEFPAPQHLALTRFVVRDRATGNLGAVDILFPRREPTPPIQASPAAAETASDLKKIQGWLNLDWAQDNGYRANQDQPPFWQPPPGPIGSFGSIVRAPNAFCGDVYELPHSYLSLPGFRDFDPIGSIYTSALDVPDQQFSNTTGIPGVTPRTNLFAIDYHAVFWVEVPGEYRFLMLSDDGAILRIDDQKVIDLDGLHMATPGLGRIHLSAGPHAIEVPYYQGAVNAVALELWVKPPGERRWMLFDMHDYAPPSANEKVSASQSAA